MQSEKFSLYDFLAFALPGATCIFLLQTLVFPLVECHFTMPQLSDALLIAPYILFSYFIGHLLSVLGIWLEKKRYPDKQPWMSYLQQDEVEAKQLNELNKKIFNQDFTVVKDEVSVTDKDRSCTFYDNVYYYLEVNGKLEKTSVLMAQYAFFRNCFSLWCVCSVFLIITLLFNLWHHTHFISFYLMVSVVSLLLTYASMRLMCIREQKMFTSVFKAFIAFTNKA